MQNNKVACSKNIYSPKKKEKTYSKIFYIDKNNLWKMFGGRGEKYILLVEAIEFIENHK